MEGYYSIKIDKKKRPVLIKILTKKKQELINKKATGLDEISLTHVMGKAY